jgi:thiamine pyrophosphate-dependent acetolactate synthase large subunit-like protein
MGHAADFALGIALAQPHRKVICLNGDGSMLMTLGTLATIIGAGVQNLILFVIQNGTYEITGNQPIPAGGRIDFATMARGAGFDRVYSFSDAARYAECLPEILTGEGPVFVVLGVEPGSEGPIRRSQREEVAYLKPSLAESALMLRQALAERSK